MAKNKSQITSPYVDLHVKRGQPMSARWANSVADILSGQSQPGSSFGFSNRFAISVTNTGTDREIGELLAYTDYTGVEPDREDEDQDDDIELSMLPNLSFEGDVPTWHDDVNKVGVCLDACEEDDSVLLLLHGLVMVRVTVTDNAHTHVMVDPEHPERLVSSTGGLGRIIWGHTKSDHAVVFWGDVQPMWRYEITGAWSDSEAEAKLLPIDSDTHIGGTERITLFDFPEYMDDQTTGGKGTCLLVGNRFIPIQANCG